jgi:hypothetical protein
MQEQFAKGADMSPKYHKWGIKKRRIYADSKFIDSGYKKCSEKLFFFLPPY